MKIEVSACRKVTRQHARIEMERRERERERERNLSFAGRMLFQLHYKLGSDVNGPTKIKLPLLVLNDFITISFVHTCTRQTSDPSSLIWPRVPVHKNKSMQRLIFSLRGTGTVKFQVTWFLFIVQNSVSVWQCCAVDGWLRTGAHDAKPISAYQLTARFFFFFFSSQKRTERAYKGKKVRWLKGRHTQATMGAPIVRKRTGLGRRGLASPASTSLGHFLHFDLFFMRCDGLLILEACPYIFYLKCTFGNHETWNFAAQGPNVWCCILLFFCAFDMTHCTVEIIIILHCIEMQKEENSHLMCLLMLECLHSTGMR